MWQADFKGHFAMRNGVRCHPLDIIDDCSRFSPLLCTARRGNIHRGKGSKWSIFLKYGMPFSFSL